MPSIPSHCIEPFIQSDQGAVRRLIDRSMAERWGELDPEANPDLRDIGKIHARGLFLVAKASGMVVGCGGIVRESSGCYRIVRMAVAPEHRGIGIGTSILHLLLQHAESRNCHMVVLETTAHWTDAVRFYQHRGFKPIRDANGDRHFEFVLAEA
jgi:putative acetyltransferase